MLVLDLLLLLLRVGDGFLVGVDDGIAVGALMGGFDGADVGAVVGDFHGAAVGAVVGGFHGADDAGTLVGGFGGASVRAVVGAVVPQVSVRVVMYVHTHADCVLQQSFMPAEIVIASAALRQAL